MQTRTITFTVPDGDYCEDTPGPGTRQSCVMLGEDFHRPHCNAYDERLGEMTKTRRDGRKTFYTLKCDECLGGA
jgi:hypothetical protein